MTPSDNDTDKQRPNEATPAAPENTPSASIPENTDSTDVTATASPCVEGGDTPSSQSDLAPTTENILANTDEAPPATAHAGGTDKKDSEEDGEEEEEDGEAPPVDRPMTLRDHLRDLRKRLLYCFLIIFAGFFACYSFAQPMFEFLMAPLIQSLPVGGQKLMYVAPAEAFFAYMKVSFVGGMFLTSPLSFYQVWAFVAPGLHKEEKFYLLPIAFFSAVCFVAGAAFCYYVAFPFIFQFLMSFNSDIIESRPSMVESLGFVLKLVVAFGCIFELPLFTFFLARIGIVTAAWMRKVRRYAILASFIIAAILSPPDVVSQLLMAAPLLILYECSILVAALFGKKPPKEPVESDDSDDAEEPTT